MQLGQASLQYQHYATVIMFVTSLAAVLEEPALSAGQLLWIKSHSGHFCHVALTMDLATEALLDRKLDKMTDALFSLT